MTSAFGVEHEFLAKGVSLTPASNKQRKAETVGLAAGSVAAGHSAAESLSQATAHRASALEPDGWTNRGVEVQHAKAAKHIKIARGKTAAAAALAGGAVASSRHRSPVGKADKRDAVGYGAASTLAGAGAAGLTRGRDYRRAADYDSHTAAKLRAVHPTERIYDLPRVGELRASSDRMRRLSVRASRGGKGALAAGALTAAGTAVAARNRKAVTKSAFGVAHDSLGKRNTNKDSASYERLATGALLPGYHGAFAGRKGRKLRAAGHEVVGGVAGSIIPGPGTLAGAAVGTNMAHKKGYYKPDHGTQRHHRKDRS